MDKEVKSYFDEHDIHYVDTLGPLSRSAGAEQIYPNNFGGHENRNGFRIIAESVKKLSGWLIGWNGTGSPFYIRGLCFYNFPFLW